MWADYSRSWSKVKDRHTLGLIAMGVFTDPSPSVYYPEPLIIHSLYMTDTIVTNSPGTNDSSAVGMIMAFIILIAVLAGGVVLYQRGVFNTSNPADTTNINVTIPTPITEPDSN